MDVHLLFISPYLYPYYNFLLLYNTVFCENKFIFIVLHFTYYILQSYISFLILHVRLITVQQPNLSHPFHLHGYAFNVVGIGRSPDRNVKKINLKHALDLDKKGLLHREFNLPPAKDTIAVPNNGYVIFRFRADNPGKLTRTIENFLRDSPMRCKQLPFVAVARIIAKVCMAHLHALTYLCYACVPLYAEISSQLRIRFGDFRNKCFK